MQWLAHGAEVRLEAGGLGRGDAEGHRELLIAQAKHAAGCGGRGEGAHRTGNMEALLIVARSNEAADTAGGLVARDEAFDEKATRGLHLLAKSQEGGHDGDCRMAAHGEIHVVIVERMARRAVDQRGGRGQRRFAAADETRGALGAVFHRLADQDVGQLFLGARNGDGEPVQQALLGAFDEVRGQVVPLEVCGLLGDFGGDSCGGHCGSSQRPQEFIAFAPRYGRYASAWGCHAV
jgi:hypothetical protein